jgi:hypothetical protein
VSAGAFCNDEGVSDELRRYLENSCAGGEEARVEDMRDNIEILLGAADSMEE